jgi:hypothetical protein
VTDADGTFRAAPDRRGNSVPTLRTAGARARPLAPPKKRHTALEGCAQAFRDLVASAKPDEAPEAEALVVLRDETTVVALAQESAGRWRKVVEALTRFCELDRRISMRTAHKVLETTALRAIGKGHDVAAVVKDMRSQLSEPPREHKVHVPIIGLDTSSLPAQFGGLLFGPAKSVVGPILGRLAGNEWVTRSIEQTTASWAENVSAATVTVRALDPDAAFEMALERVQRTVDALHFFTFGLGPAYPHVRIRAGAPITRSYALVEWAENGGGLSFPAMYDGAFPPLKLPDEQEDPLFAPVSELFAAEVRSPVIELLSTSIAWSGRAVKEPRRTAAFLQQAIALESLAIPVGTSEVTQRLALRVARILGEEAADRRHLFDEVKRWYAIRSDIAHNGVTFVSSVDLGYFASTVRWFIRKLVWLHREAPLSAIKTLDDLDSWFVEQTLA